MVFIQGEPKSKDKLSAKVIRDNFDALYQQLKTLEPRATEIISSSILIEGGPVYFKANSSSQLKFINFQTSLIDLKTAQGYRTQINEDGSKDRVLLPAKGISPFLTGQLGFYREVLVFLSPEGRLYFTEGSTTTNGISRAFDIFMSDADIPICLVLVRNVGELNKYGQIGNIQQVNIRDIRPVVSIAIQSNNQISDLQNSVSDNSDRLDILENRKTSANYFEVSIDPFALTSDKKLYIESGKTYIDGKYVKFPGKIIDLTIEPNRPPFIPSDNFNTALICFDVRTKDIKTIYGTSEDSVTDWRNCKYPSDVRDVDNDLITDPTIIPLSVLTYRAIRTDDQLPTREIYPINNLTHIGDVRINYEFSITSIDQDQVSIQLSEDCSEDIFNQIFESGFPTERYVEIKDDNTISFRRTIVSVISRNYNLKQKTIKLDRPLIGIDIKRYPKIKDLEWYKEVLEDVRALLVR